MGLLISLGRDLPEKDLGEHDFVDLEYDRLLDPRGNLLARHRANRWAPESGRHYVRLSVLGPLVVVSPSGEKKRLGPYEQFSTYNGVGYVESRVFAFTDLQQHDWYVMNAGEHWPTVRIAFHLTGP